jgi:hypothetical protein
MHIAALKRPNPDLNACRRLAVMDLIDASERAIAVAHVGVGMKSICTICARGGSKGVAGKNARELLGKPLLAWTIDQARQTGLFEAIAFSSDSELLLRQHCSRARILSSNVPRRWLPIPPRRFPPYVIASRRRSRVRESRRRCLSTSTSPRRCGCRPTLPAHWNSSVDPAHAASSRARRAPLAVLQSGRGTNRRFGRPVEAG